MRSVSRPVWRVAEQRQVGRVAVSASQHAAAHVDEEAAGQRID